MWTFLWVFFVIFKINPFGAATEVRLGSCRARAWCQYEYKIEEPVPDLPLELPKAEEAAKEEAKEGEEKEEEDDEEEDEKPEEEKEEEDEEKEADADRTAPGALPPFICKVCMSPGIPL